MIFVVFEGARENLPKARLNVCHVGSRSTNLAGEPCGKLAKGVPSVEPEFSVDVLWCDAHGAEPVSRSAHQFGLWNASDWLVI